MTRDLTTDSNRLIREEEEEGREDREINTNLAREPIFYAKFSTRRFHRSRTDNRLKYSERARGEGWRKCAAPAIYDKRGKGRGALKSEVVCACSANGNVDRVLIWREGGKYSYWWWCNQFAVRILLNPISRSRCQVNRDSFHWRGERVERTLLPSSSSLYLDPIHQGVLPSRRTCKKTRGRGSKRRQTDPSSPWNLVHSLPSSRVPRKIRTRGVDRWTGRKYWIKQIKVARAAISRSESRVQGDGGGGTMKRDTGDEIRMKLRYGRSNPWFSIRRVLSLPSLSLSLPLSSLLPAGHPLDNLSVCRYVQTCAISTRRKGFLFFVFLPSLSLPFPSSFFSSRVEIRDRCLTFSRIPSGTKSSGNSNSRGGRDRIETYPRIWEKKLCKSCGNSWKCND